MNIFENPFCILSASPWDSKKKLRELYEEKRLLQDDISCDLALQVLTHPVKRLSAELRWFSACPELSSVIEHLKECLERPSCTLDHAMNINYGEAYVSQLNGLITLLPHIEDRELDTAISMVLRIESRISPSGMLQIINSDREKAGFPEIQDIKMFEMSLKEYFQEISGVIIKRLEKLPITGFCSLVTKFAVDTMSEICESIVESYQLTVTELLHTLAEELQTCAAAITNSTSSASHYQVIEKIKAIALQWKRYIYPLQIHAIALGSQAAVNSEEKEIYPILMNTGIKLVKQSLHLEALSIFEILLGIIPEDGIYADQFQSIKGIIQTLYQKKQEFNEARLAEYKQKALLAWEKEQRENDQAIRERAKKAELKEKKWEREQKAARDLEFKRLSKQAWEEEQRKNDEFMRRQAQEATEKEKRIIEQRRANRQREEELRAFQERYKKTDGTQKLNKSKRGLFSVLFKKRK